MTRRLASTGKREMLTPGMQLGDYEVVSMLGKGGMGEVWLARDTKLDRDVAIKVLPALFAEDEERALRFEREAKVLASLNHPNIAAIHGLEEADGTRFIVNGPADLERRGGPVSPRVILDWLETLESNAPTDALE